MGLDIFYTDKLEKVPEEDVPSGVRGYTDDYYKWEEKSPHSLWWTYNQQWWPHHSDGLEEESWYYDKGENKDGFRAGSYSGYNTWRNDLAMTMGWLSGVEGAWEEGEQYGPPFMELINFPDNEGYIGPVVSEKLYQDFVKYEDQVMDKIDQWFLKMDPDKEYDVEDLKWFESKYQKWKEAFNQARKGGLVSFQ